MIYPKNLIFWAPIFSPARVVTVIQPVIPIGPDINHVYSGTGNIYKRDIFHF